MGDEADALYDKSIDFLVNDHFEDEDDAAEPKIRGTYRRNRNRRRFTGNNAEAIKGRLTKRKCSKERSY